MEIRVINKTFCGIIVCYILLFTYLVSLIFTTPLVGIEIKKMNHQWVVNDFVYPNWAAKHNIEKGTVIKEVNNEFIEASNAEILIKGASSILIQNKKGTDQLIEISYADFPVQFIFYILIPITYFVITLIVCFYLHVKKNHFQSSNVFMLFMLTVAITYLSIGIASHSYNIGIFIVSNGVIGSFVFLIHFLINYLQYLKIKQNWLIKPLYLYGILIVSVIFTLLENIVPSIYNWNTTLILILVGLLMLYSVLILFIAYIKYRKEQLIVLLICLITPFIPIIIFYILPLLLFQRYVFSIFYCALSLLLIPILLLLIQLPNYLFDMDYEISKVRYYSGLSLITSSILSIGCYFIFEIQMFELFKSLLFFFLVILGSMYIKERIDYTNRKVLYSPKGDYVHFVYKMIQHLTCMESVDELLKHFSKVLEQQLAVSDVKVHVYSTDDSENNPKMIESLSVGTIKKVNRCYIGCLHETLDKKYIVTITNNDGLYLKKEELLCLELLIIYVSNFIDHTQFVEEIIEQLNKSQQGNPAWLNKFIWLQLENEKSHLAQELHDTILQQQLYLIRELDVSQIDKQLIKRQRDYLIQLNTDLRQYCEKLKPPLLDKQGLQVVLNKFLLEIERQADFTIIYEIDDLVLESLEIPLLIFRTVQEMLNNALKHSQATYVKVMLSTYEQGFELIYFDNGVGCELSDIYEKSSMGIRGMKERVLAYNGCFELTSAPGEGMHIVIKFKEMSKDD